MPTMVQQPDLITPEVSRLQAIDRPVERSGLSSFLTELLPQVKAGFDEYQKENRDHYIALGRNDELNGVQRDVSIIDSHNYNQGKEFQKVTSTQAEQQQLFRDTVTQMARDGKSAEEIFDAGKQYLTGYTNTVHDSQLQSDLKEVLYNAGLKENAAYQTLISKTINEVALQREQFDSQTRTANTYKLLTEQNHTPTQITELLEAHVQKAFAAKIASNVGIDPKEAMQAAQSEVQTMFKYWAGQIDPSSPDAAAFVNTLNNTLDVAVQGGIVSMSTVVDLQSNSNGIRSQILENNGIQLENSMKEGMWNIQRGNAEYSHDFVQTQLTDINRKEAQGLLTPAKAAQLRDNLFSFGETQYNKLLQAELDPAQLVKGGVSMMEYAALGKGGEDSYSGHISNYYDGINNGDPVAAGSAKVAHALRGDPNGENLPSLMRNGTQQLSSQFVSFLSLPQEQAAKQPHYQNAVKAYDSLKATYMQLKAQGSPLAEQLLAGVPEDYRGTVMEMFAGNANMNASAEALRNPVQTNQRQKNVSDAIQAMNWDNVGGNKWFGRGVGGGSRLLSGISEDVRGSYMKNMEMVYSDSKHALANGSTSANPELLVANATALGMHVKSPSGYNDALFTAGASKVYHNITYKGVKLSADYIGHATDELRRTVAKSANSSPDNVLIHTDRTGRYVIVQPFDKNGKLLKDKQGDAFQGEVYNQSQFVNLMKKAYDDDQAKYKKHTSTFETIGAAFSSKGVSDTLGSTANYKEDMAKWRKESKSYTLNTAGSLGQTVISLPNGTKTQAKIPTLASVPFNGNVQLATAWQGYLNNYEGFKPTIGVVKGTGTDSDGLIIGNGVNLNTHPKWKQKFQAAQGNPQALLNLQAEFMSQNMKDQQVVAKSLGIPVATNKPYNPQFISAQLLLADYKWHNGNYNTIKLIMQEPTYSKALARMRKSAAYTHADDGHRRNVARRNMLRDYYLAMGKL